MVRTGSVPSWEKRTTDGDSPIHAGKDRVRASAEGLAEGVTTVLRRLLWALPIMSARMSEPSTSKVLWHHLRPETSPGGDMRGCRG